MRSCLSCAATGAARNPSPIAQAAIAAVSRFVVLPNPPLHRLAPRTLPAFPPASTDIGRDGTPAHRQDLPKYQPVLHGADSGPGALPGSLSISRLTGA